MIADDLSRIAMSPSLGSALARAGEFARRLGHGEVTLEHMLLSLCEDPDAGLVLAASNIDGNRLKNEVTAFFAALPQRGAPGQVGEPGVSLDLRRILEAAAAAARGGRRREINGAIVLAAIVGDGRSPAAQMLQAQGLTFEGAIRALQRGTAVATRGPASSSTEDILASARERVLSRTGGLAARKTQAAPVEEEPAAPEVEIAEFEADDAGFAAADTEVAAAREPEPQAKPASKPAPKPAPTPEPKFIGEAERAPPPPAPPPSAPARPPQPESVQPPARAAPPPPAEAAQPPMPPPIPGPQAAPPSRPPPSTSDNAMLASESAPPFRVSPGSSDSAMLSSPSPFPHRVQRPVSDRAVLTSPSPMPPPIPPMPSGGGELQIPGRGAAPSPDQPSLRHRLEAEPPRRPMGIGAASSGPSAYEKFSRTRQAPPGAAPAPPVARPVPQQRAEIGQLVENIPRTMRVAVPALVEVRIAKAEVKALADGLQGGGAAYRHEVTITKAMSVRLRAPDGGFFIETASPETQWIEGAVLLSSDDFASWRWHVTPREKGKKRLQLIISARTVGADGLAAETALPDQVITVRVRTNYAKTASHLVGWGVAALIGGLLAKFGEGLLDVGVQIVAKLTAG